MADRDVTVRLRADISQFSRSMATASAETSALGKNADGSGKAIDRLSGRLRLAADAALVLGPALAPIGAAAVGGIVALSAQLGALAGGLGVTLLAVNGLGDGLKALDKYQLEPTAENLKKLNDEMKALGPAGEDFVRFLDSIEPNLKTLQNAAREGLLPGAQEGIEALMQRLPELRKLIRGMATEMGDLFSDAGGAIGGPGFDAFFKYLRTDGIKILDDTGRTIGNLTEAVANLFVAFGGVSTDFSGGLLKFSQGLAEASANLDSSAGFQEFVDYIQTEGPHALETIGALGNALLQIVEATAPLGGPVLTVVKAFADAIARIADSDIGTPLFAGLAALALLNRSMAITASLTAATFGGPAVASMRAYVVGLGTVTSAQQRAQMSATELDAANAKTSRGFGKFALPAAGLALTMSGVADNTGLANTAMLSMAGPWGAAAGFALDVWNATDGLDAALADLSTASASGDMLALAASLERTNAELEKTRANTILGSDALGGFVGGVVNTIAPMSNASKFMGDLTGKTDGLAYQAELAKIKLSLLAAAEDEAGGAAEAAVGPLRDIRDASERAAEASDKQAAAINGAIEAMHAMREEANRAANAELDYQQSIDDANKALKENGKTHDKTTEKGRDNLRALYNLAGAWNGQSEVIKGNSGLLREARDNFIRTAEAMGIATGDARRLSRELFDIPEKRQTKVTVDSAAAEAALARLNRFKFDPKVIAVQVQAHGGSAGGPLDQEPTADGGTVPKSGRGYADRYSYLLADGEEVISNRHGQADRHRSLLKAINAGRMADGGTAGKKVSHATMLISEHGTDIIGNANGVAKALKMLQAALASSEKSLDRETQARDDLASQAAAFASQVGGAYSTADPFAMAQSSGSVWGSGSAANPLGSFDSALSGNIASTQAAQQALAFAQSHGLDGPLYAALAASGNLPLLQQFAQLSASEIDVREAQFAAQSNAQSSLGASAAAGAGMTAQLTAANAHLDQIRAEVRELRKDVKVADRNNQEAQAQNAHQVTAGVNGAAANGHKHKHRGH